MSRPEPKGGNPESTGLFIAIDTFYIGLKMHYLSSNIKHFKANATEDHDFLNKLYSKFTFFISGNQN